MEKIIATLHALVHCEVVSLQTATTAESQGQSLGADTALQQPAPCTLKLNPLQCAGWIQPSVDSTFLTSAVEGFAGCCIECYLGADHALVLIDNERFKGETYSSAHCEVVSLQTATTVGEPGPAFERFGRHAGSARGSQQCSANSRGRQSSRGRQYSEVPNIRAGRGRS